MKKAAEAFAGKFHDIKGSIVGRLKASLAQAVKVSIMPFANGHGMKADFLEEKAAPGQKELLRGGLQGGRRRSHQARSYCGSRLRDGILPRLCARRN